MATTVLSLREEGTARLVFDKDYSSFEGVLINRNEEVFALRGISPRSSSTSVDESSSDYAEDADTQPSDILKRLPGLLPICDLYVVDEETGTNFVLKKVKINEGVNVDDPEAVQISLASDHVTFASTEVLIGNRADMEFRQYMNPLMVGRSLPVYVGPMKINFHTAITPPTSPMPIPSAREEEMPRHPVRSSFSRSYTKDYSLEFGTPMGGDFLQ